MKIDVEGYEHEVVVSAESTLSERRVTVLAIDYHGTILASRGIDPKSIDARIRSKGYRLDSGNAESGYCIYRL